MAKKRNGATATIKTEEAAMTLTLPPEKPVEPVKPPVEEAPQQSKEAPTLAKAIREILQEVGVETDKQGASNADILAAIKAKYPTLEINEKSFAATVSVQRGKKRDGKGTEGRKPRTAREPVEPAHINRTEFINVVRAIKEDVESFQSSFNSVGGVVALAGGWEKLVEAMAKIEDEDNLARAVRMVEMEDDSKALGF